MKFFIYFIILLATYNIYSQESETLKYNFDHISVYIDSIPVEGKYERIIVLSNTLDNSFVATIKEITEDSLYFVFQDFNRLYERAIISKEDFQEADVIELKNSEQYIKMNDLLSIENKNQYAYKKTTDTVIEGEKFARFNFSFSKKRKKRSKLDYTDFFIMEPNTSYNKKLVLDRSSYEVLRKTNPDATGIFKKSYHSHEVNPKYHHNSQSLNLDDYGPYKKEIIIRIVR